MLFYPIFPPSENPFATFFTDDYNTHSQLWWPDGDTTPGGLEIENLITSLGLSQIISEPTNFEPNRNPSCIDLIITDQPNLILDCGTRASLDSYCHHQIVEFSFFTYLAKSHYFYNLVHAYDEIAIRLIVR